jgi:hypothetical protein
MAQPLPSGPSAAERTRAFERFELRLHSPDEGVALARRARRWACEYALPAPAGPRDPML